MSRVSAGRTDFVRASTSDTLEQIYRFRYEVYVKHMRRTQKWADHSAQRIEEPLDRGAINCAMMVNGRVVGVVRGNLFSDAAASYYRSLYRIKQFSGYQPGELAFTTKLMILPEYRGTMLAAKMLREFAGLIYAAGVKLNFIDCNKPLIPMFEQMGYFSYMGWAFHKEFGTVRPMFLATDTLRYQKAIKSALYHAAAPILRDGEYNGYEAVERYASRPQSKAVSGVADWFFHFPSPVVPNLPLCSAVCASTNAD